MINIFIANSDRNEFLLSNTEGLSIKQNLLDIKLKDKEIIENFISLVKSSESSILIINNFITDKNIELFLSLENYNFNGFKAIDFNLLTELNKQICLDFIKFYKL